MATEIKFATRGGVKEYAEFVSDGNITTIEVEREKFSYFTVYANLDGMEPVSVYNEPHIQNLIFQVDVPAGVKVTLDSGSHVTKAKKL